MGDLEGEVKRGVTGLVREMGGVGDLGRKVSSEVGLPALILDSFTAAFAAGEVPELKRAMVC